MRYNLQQDKAPASNERGVALIIAIILVLVMSAIASTISFISNNDFLSMSHYKREREAFLAAESCISEARSLLETQLAGTMPEGYRSFINNDAVFVRKSMRPEDNLLPVEDWIGSMCRFGHRKSASDHSLFTNPSNFLIANESKSCARINDFSVNEFCLNTQSIIVTGKDGTDKDKEDKYPGINTGIEIIAGFELKHLK